ncbi:tRNA 2-methylthioadenosine synthase-like protein [Candidatus Methylomirabilis lanthanidiphila]|uniref:tRNA-2-methylthio-N(6)-dimethylallyladenosine synthase n=1 Tax=Candidatus Methylomirabilis lanthanidiphila TaxID=2211376 RepID=A0A564ZFB3_9BACT|nr:tRNA (N6-isopentenyl adenosine(37)-C2)-methylthiotransferase MiaB [Candidatus Methylomirabilis lanthanidiphila]VUZ83974.1 tRNA 2-methylthioadenosine synthase-like protein [Candidatus Methylomirabilis lanthanidiphila]
MPKLKLITYGCQANDLDSERITGLLLREGFTLTEQEEEADLIVLNTCAIREKAEHKVYSRLGSFQALKRQRAGLKIGICGCVAQQEGQALLNRFPYLDFVVGPGQLTAIPTLLQAGAARGVATARAAGYSYPVDAPVQRRSGIRAWVSIMEGCDRFCTFCVVPFTRGRERSRPPQAIIEEIRELKRQGYREVTLLGQTVNSYGRKLTPPISFVELLRHIDQLVGDYMRVRFTSPHPSDVTDELAAAIAELPSLCEQIHLPVQSGSDRILHQMKRGYNREEYLEKVALLRAKAPDIAITTDIIVGFPGETEEDFQATLDLMQEVGFDGAFIFKYSPRPHTEAEGMPDQLSEEVKGRWLEHALRLLNQSSLERNRAYIGRTVEVLVNREDAKVDTVRHTGRTRQNKIVHFRGDEVVDGSMVQVAITEATPLYLQGEIVC